MRRLRQWSEIALLPVILLFVWGCTSNLPPAKQTIQIPREADGQLFNRAVKALLKGGYEIKTRDESAGIIQALRPMRGAFAKPGYGHNVTIEVGQNNLTVTAFPMAGAIGAQSPEEIKQEVISLIQSEK